MFSGIITHLGIVRARAGRGLWIDVSFANNLKQGQSIAVNGVCLTVVETDRQGFQVELLDETKNLTNLNDLKKGDLVNLERALKIGDRLDGHVVQGHVEGVCVIKKIVQEKPRQKKKTWKISLEVPKKFLKYMIWKGIVILDGIALTISRLDDRESEIEVAITAYTWENTNLIARRVGDRVNVETDIVGKYIEKLVESVEKYPGNEKDMAILGRFRAIVQQKYVFARGTVRKASD